MTQDEIRAIALEVAEAVGINPWGITDFATRFLAAIAEKAEPVAEIIGANSGGRDVQTIAVEGKLIPKGTKLYTHPAIEPAPQQQRPAYGGTCANLHETVQVPNAVGVAPLPDEVAQMVERLRGAWKRDVYIKFDDARLAADLIERLARQRAELLETLEYLKLHKLWINSHAKAIIEAAIAKAKP